MCDQTTRSRLIGGVHRREANKPYPQLNTALLLMLNSSALVEIKIESG